MTSASIVGGANMGRDRHDRHGVPSAAALQAFCDAALRERRKEYGAAPATVEAVVYELRTYSLAALAERNCQRRIGELNHAQIGEAIERLHGLRSTYPAITDDLILALAELK
jgi:hypothetical protein